MLFWIVLFVGLGLAVLNYSRHQPFPEISGRFALVLLVTGAILWLSTTAPRETSESVPAVIATVVGGIAGHWGDSDVDSAERRDSCPLRRHPAVYGCDQSDGGPMVGDGSGRADRLFLCRLAARYAGDLLSIQRSRGRSTGDFLVKIWA